MGPVRKVSLFDINSYFGSTRDPHFRYDKQGGVISWKISEMLWSLARRPNASTTLYGFKRKSYVRTTKGSKIWNLADCACRVSPQGFWYWSEINSVRDELLGCGYSAPPSMMYLSSCLFRTAEGNKPTPYILQATWPRYPLSCSYNHKLSLPFIPGGNLIPPPPSPVTFPGPLVVSVLFTISSTRPFCKLNAGKIQTPQLHLKPCHA